MEEFERILKVILLSVVVIKMVSIITTRVCSMYYIYCRYTSHGYSVFHMIHQPKWYKGVSLTFEDKVRLISLRLFSDIVSFTDYKYERFPFRLSELDKVKSYMRKTGPTTLVALGLLSSLLYKHEYIFIVLYYYLHIMFVFLLWSRIFDKVHKFRYYTEAVVRVFNISLLDVIQFTSFNLISLRKKMKIRQFVIAGTLLIIFARLSKFLT